MNKTQAIRYAIVEQVPDYKEILQKFAKNNPNKDFSLENIVRILSLEKYNLAKELNISAVTTSNLIKAFLKDKIQINKKLCTQLLALAELKYCSNCKTVKPFSAFRKNKSKSDGLNGFCFSCHSHTTAETQVHRQAKYRAKLINALPAWANLAEIEKIYENCPEGYHVDHLIPLNGELVSGLHVPENLIYLSATDNIRKYNSFDIEKYNSGEVWYELNTQQSKTKTPAKTISTRKEDIFGYTKEYVEQVIWSMPFIKAGPFLSMSDNGLRKMATRMGCRLPPPRFHLKSESEKTRLKDELIPEWRNWTALET